MSAGGKSGLRAIKKPPRAALEDRLQFLTNTPSKITTTPTPNPSRKGEGNTPSVRQLICCEPNGLRHRTNQPGIDCVHAEDPSAAPSAAASQEHQDRVARGRAHELDGALRG